MRKLTWNQKAAIVILFIFLAYIVYLLPAVKRINSVLVYARELNAGQQHKNTNVVFENDADSVTINGFLYSTDTEFTLWWPVYYTVTDDIWRIDVYYLSFGMKQVYCYDGNLIFHIKDDNGMLHLFDIDIYI